jgi:AcrR family transcriptional regulator
MARSPALRDRIATGILEKAAVVLAERGEATSMADVAAAAGVGRATLYRYFPGRDRLLGALADMAVEELSERIAEAELDTIPVPEGIARLTRAFVAAASRYVALMRVGAKPAASGETDRQIIEPLRGLLRRGAADGTLRQDLPVEVLLAMFGGLLETAIDLSTRRGLGVERASAAVATIFLSGVRDRPAER